MRENQKFSKKYERNVFQFLFDARIFKEYNHGCVQVFMLFVENMRY